MRAARRSFIRPTSAGRPPTGNANLHACRGRFDRRGVGGRLRLQQRCAAPECRPDDVGKQHCRQCVCGPVEFRHGSLLQFATLLLGETAATLGNGVAVDSLNNGYVSGVTYSSAFQTTTGALQTALDGTFNAFVTKFSPEGLPFSIRRCWGVAAPTAWQSR